MLVDTAKLALARESESCSGRLLPLLGACLESDDSIELQALLQELRALKSLYRVCGDGASTATCQSLLRVLNDRSQLTQLRSDGRLATLISVLDTLSTYIPGTVIPASIRYRLSQAIDCLTSSGVRDAPPVRGAVGVEALSRRHFPDYLETLLAPYVRLPSRFSGSIADQADRLAGLAVLCDFCGLQRPVLSPAAADECRALLQLQSALPGGSPLQRARAALYHTLSAELECVLTAVAESATDGEYRVGAIYRYLALVFRVRALQAVLDMAQFAPAALLSARLICLILREPAAVRRSGLRMLLRLGLYMQQAMVLEADTGHRPALHRLLRSCEDRLKRWGELLLARADERREYLYRREGMQSLADREIETWRKRIELVVGETGCCDRDPHVSPVLCSLTYKLALDLRGAGHHQLFCMADSLRVSLFSAMQMQWRLDGRWRETLRMFCVALKTGSGGKAEECESVLLEQLLCLEAETLQEQARKVSERMPGSLASGFRMLPGADQALRELSGTGLTPDKQQILVALQRELEMLRRGASTMHVYRIEALAVVMLKIYSLLSADPELWRDASLRAILLRAHRRLRRMLDQAAAWQEVSTARTVIASLYAWLERQPVRAADSPGQALQQLRVANTHIQSLLKQNDPEANRTVLLELLAAQDERLDRLKSIFRVGTGE